MVSVGCRILYWYRRHRPSTALVAGEAISCHGSSSRLCDYCHFPYLVYHIRLWFPLPESLSHSHVPSVTDSCASVSSQSPVPCDRLSSAAQYQYLPGRVPQPPRVIPSTLRSPSPFSRAGSPPTASCPLFAYTYTRRRTRTVCARSPPAQAVPDSFDLRCIHTSDTYIHMYMQRGAGLGLVYPRHIHLQLHASADWARSRREARGVVPEDASLTLVWVRPHAVYRLDTCLGWYFYVYLNVVVRHGRV